MLTLLRASRAVVFVSSISVGIVVASACGGGSDGTAPSPVDDAGGSPGDGSSVAPDGDARADSDPPRKECMPYLQSGTPISFAPTHRAVADDPSDGLVALDPVGDMIVGDYSVTNFSVGRKTGGFYLHCASSTLSIAQMFSDATGNVYLAGTFRFLLDVPGAAPDGGALEYGDTDGKRVFLAKFDAKGDLVYLQRYLGAPKLTGAALGAGGHIWIAGTTEAALDFGLGELAPGAPGGSAFLVELDGNGVALANRTFGNATMKTGRMAIGSDGGPVVALYLGTALPGVPQVGIGVGAFSASGTDRFIKAFQSTSSSKGAVATSIAVSPQDDIAISGRYLGAPDFGGGPLPAADTDAKPYLAKVSSAGAYVGAPALPPSVDPPVGGLVVAFHSNGNLVFGASLEGPFDFGLGTVKPVTSPLAPLLLTFDPAMTLVGASTFAPQCLTPGSSGGVRGLAVDPAGALRIVAANGVTTWVSMIEP